MTKLLFVIVSGGRQHELCAAQQLPAIFCYRGLGVAEPKAATHGLAITVSVVGVRLLVAQIVSLLVSYLYPWLNGLRRSVDMAHGLTKLVVCAGLSAVQWL